MQPQPQKSKTTAILLCVFLGFLGIHRFYLGHTAIGLIQLLTCGGCAIWATIDVFLLATDKLTDQAGNPLV